MATAKHDEEKPFLQTIDEEYVPQNTPKRRTWTSLSTFHYILFVIHAAFIAANVGLFVLNTYGEVPSTTSTSSTTSKVSLARDEVEDPYSPAHSIIKHEIRTLDLEPEDSPFLGLPRREVDEAWSDLLAPSMVEISKREMHTMNKTSVKVKDSEGYVGYYEVFHQLHCLKRMYQMNYKEHYPDLLSSGRLTVPHWEHCLEVLRQGVMCKPDLTLNTVVWDAEAPTGLHGYTHHERRCVNWDSFKAFADQSAIPAPLEDYVVPHDMPGNVGPF
ncbi:hypothetical protein AC579_3842 [Pseudocercospora musae]|uniref:DUF3328 domain-containing protein n=1 Tax=Pseudocercospora musae TaxID=113226 RepID=A0A139IRY4_9PEZI|nr:hypothetical protein AC579_3842 [Pseudocercospora musae]